MKKILLFLLLAPFGYANAQYVVNYKRVADTYFENKDYYEKKLKKLEKDKKSIENTEIQELKEKIVGKELLKKEIESEIYDSMKEIIEEILVEPFDVAEKIKEKSQEMITTSYINHTFRATDNTAHNVSFLYIPF